MTFTSSHTALRILVLFTLVVAGCGSDTTPPGDAGSADAAVRTDGGGVRDRDGGGDTTDGSGDTTDGGVVPGEDGGPSRTDGGTPPGYCTSNEHCADSEICVRPVGMCGGGGACAARPGSCPDVRAPVCGCDGVLYGNECEARAAGVVIATTGACPAPGDCTSNADCADGELCNRPIGMCGAPGSCEMRPSICPLLYAPVCGCNGSTYDNECNARSGGTAVEHEGPC